MTRKRYLTWLLEFASIVAIGLIPMIQGLSPYWISIPVIVILILKIFEFQSAASEKRSKVDAQLKLLYSLIPFDPAARVRCTYHIPIWRKKLRQEINYIPTETGGGRVFDAHKGIIGKAFMNKKSFVENFGSDAEYRQKMVDDYRYTPQEIAERSADRRSYFCHPLIDENHRVFGLIYFDAVKPSTFPGLDDPKVYELMINLDMIGYSIL